MHSHAFVRALAVSLLLCLVTSARSETILYDSNGFEAPTFTAGSSPFGQDDSNPWQAFGGSPTAYSVESSKVASGAQAIEGDGGGLNDGSYVWPNLGYTPGPNERVRIQVDMARTLSPNVDDSSPVYAIDIADQNIDRTSRFGLQQSGGEIRTFISVPINASGNIDPNGPGIRSEFYGPAIAQDTFVHFDFTLDYTSKTVNLSVDGTPLAAGVPFRTQTSAFLDSAAFQIGTFPESSDHGYFDNYVVSVVPYLAGDANTDGIVNSQDLAAVSSNWLATGVLPAGDVNEDGIVNSQDLALISSNWLQALNGSGAGNATAVPEPGTFALLLLATACALTPAGKRRFWNH
ncbi:MAG TPA: hypothetical protein VFE62_23825 [Gemmataceae bacterium]|nr:hypothetical protein [Pirellulales bacterium]HZZ81552.1 hypothetical protein [Gemmataceae bacterium]